MKRVLWAAGILAVVVMAVLLWPASAGSPRAIMGLAKGGASEQELMHEVRKSTKAYTLSADDVIDLKNAKVPDAVIVELLEKQPKPVPKEASSTGTKDSSSVKLGSGS